LFPEGSKNSFRYSELAFSYRSFSQFPFLLYCRCLFKRFCVAPTKPLRVFYPFLVSFYQLYSYHNASHIRGIVFFFLPVLASIIPSLMLCSFRLTLRATFSPSFCARRVHAHPPSSIRQEPTFSIYCCYCYFVYRRAVILFVSYTIRKGELIYSNVCTIHNTRGPHVLWKITQYTCMLYTRIVRTHTHTHTHMTSVQTYLCVCLCVQYKKKAHVCAAVPYCQIVYLATIIL